MVEVPSLKFAVIFKPNFSACWLNPSLNAGFELIQLSSSIGTTHSPSLNSMLKVILSGMVPSRRLSDCSSSDGLVL